jgi:nucleoside-diphosphate-sugar epimerase
MSVLVTGASGRVGANVVKRLVEAGHEVTAMVPPADPQAAKLADFPSVRIAEADLRDQGSIEVACEGVTRVVHLAAQLVRGTTPVDEFYDINALGTLRLLEGALRCGGGLERFVLISTDGTYRPGDPPAVPLLESAPQEPAEYYGTSKLLGEVILRNHAAQYGFPHSIVRFATVVSPEEAPPLFQLGYWRALFRRAELGRDSNIWQLFRDRPDLLSILEAAAGDANEKTPVAMVGPSGAPWTIHLLDVRDAVEGVHLALTHPEGGEGGVFNIAAAEPTSHLEGTTTLEELLGSPALTISMPMTWRLELSIDAACERLGYRPKHDYRSMIEAGRTADASFIPARIEAVAGR